MIVRGLPIIIVLLVGYTLATQIDITKSVAELITNPKKPNFHTPALSSETYLPRTISNEYIIGPEHGTVLVNDETLIEKSGSLVIMPGTTLAVHEYVNIRVAGKLTARGSVTQPISFISNEAREENRVWGGVLFMNGSEGSIEHASFHHASPGVSCENGSSVSIHTTDISVGNLAVFGNCEYTP